MRKSLFIMSFAALLVGCASTKPAQKAQEETASAAPKALVIDNSLTEAEKAARKFTPEVMG